MTPCSFGSIFFLQIHRNIYVPSGELQHINKLSGVISSSSQMHPQSQNTYFTYPKSSQLSSKVRHSAALKQVNPINIFTASFPKYHFNITCSLHGEFLTVAISGSYRSNSVIISCFGCATHHIHFNFLLYCCTVHFVVYLSNTPTKAHI